MVQGAGGTQGYKYIYLYLTNTVIIKFKNANDLAPQAPKLSQSSSRAQSGHPQVPGDAARTALPSFPTQGSWRGRPEVRALGGEIHRQEAGWGGTASKARADSWCDLETVGLRAGGGMAAAGPSLHPQAFYSKQTLPLLLKGKLTWMHTTLPRPLHLRVGQDTEGTSCPRGWASMLGSWASTDPGEPG